MKTTLIPADTSKNAQALTDMASVLVPFDPFDTDTWTEPGTETYWIMHCGARIGIVSVKRDAAIAENYFDNLPKCPGSLYVLLIGVLPQYRRRKIAKRTFQEVIAVARDRHMRVLQSNCRESNRASERLHLSSGFKVTGKLPGYYPNPLEDTITFSMDL